MKALNLSLVSFILALTFVSPQGSGFAKSGDERTQSTAHYRMTLDIDPVPTMLRPDQVSSATEGEVPLSMPGMPMPKMAMNMALPCRISVYQEGGKTKIGMIRPTALLALSPGGSALNAVAEDAERLPMRMIDEAR